LEERSKKELDRITGLKAKRFATEEKEEKRVKREKQKG
jgi:hypothetical protein